MVLPYDKFLVEPRERAAELTHMSPKERLLTSITWQLAANRAFLDRVPLRALVVRPELAGACVALYSKPCAEFSPFVLARGEKEVRSFFAADDDVTIARRIIEDLNLGIDEAKLMKLPVGYHRRDTASTVLVVYARLDGHAFAPCHPRHHSEPGWLPDCGIGDLLCRPFSERWDAEGRWEWALVEQSEPDNDASDYLVFELPRRKLPMFLSIERQGEWIQDWLRLHGKTVARFEVLTCHLPWDYLKEHQRDWMNSEPAVRRAMVIRRSLEARRRWLEGRRFDYVEKVQTKQVRPELSVVPDAVILD